MMTLRAETEVGGRVLSIETGKIAKQAHGSALVRYGETVVLCTVVSAAPREGIDFFPLTVDYREKMYAAGKFPGGFFKREGRPTQKEILTMRLIDRPIRPLFPSGYMDEVQIQCMVLSADQENDPDILAMNGASACLMNSTIPFEGPTAAVRVGRVNGEFVLNPTVAQREKAELELVLAGHKDAVNMIEVGANELPEDVVAEAIRFGHEAIKSICNTINELAAKVGATKDWTPPETKTALKDKVRQMAEKGLRDAKRTVKKKERETAVKALYDHVMDTLSPKDAVNPEFERKNIYHALQELEEKVVRETILKEGIRPDGRGMEDIRPITSEVSYLPRTHGSAIFSRGETQALVVLTLGTTRDEQVVDDLLEEYSKKFMLHYNFPPFSVGEVRRIGSPGRREIGHGALAERALQAVLPTPEKFPYTIRLVSDILESNGSSSMASVCGGTLALMDGGVPIRHPVAGISIGLVEENGKTVLLTDILGEEDHFGDMDF
ncbi:MAG: polyribonucleotide nucleotidyltransferase, partial [Phycisphaerae bacterium]|nr:polyribonucleotide nucleotidyltransferase [Phycisphaerae bacterium]